jgi:predicted site-specific integrase-resolvase
MPVSSAARKPDLKARPGGFLRSARRGECRIVEEGGSLNLKRSKFLAIMEKIEARQVSHRCTQGPNGALPNSLVRTLLRRARRGVAGPQRATALARAQEMMQDLPTVVPCFSAHLYGLRNYCKKLNEALVADIL